jgi:hypothetical protein
MSTIKDIGNKLYSNEKIYTPTFISKLNDSEKKKLRDNTDDENSFLILVLYLLLISFVIVMLILISQGDKHSPYPDDRKFRGDKKSKELSFWDKTYYLIFGRHRVPNHASACTHLTCRKAGTMSGNNDTIRQGSTDTKYDYLSVFNNISGSSDNGNDSGDSSELDSQFNESRKCLIGNDLSNDNNNGKYSYLGASIDDVELD